METLIIYLIKSSGLIGLFFLSYFILLRKETFFNSNRWYLLAGLITSVVLPLIFFTKIVWVDPSPIDFDWSKIPLSKISKNETFVIDWFLVAAIVYAIGAFCFLIKFGLDFYSLSKILKGKTVQHQDDFKFIDVQENISPFSYFNAIVYNSSLYCKSELENILTHEKVHSSQNHTIDVLVSRLFCIVFWFNPFIWFYKKAIVQNLEFIADYEASKILSDKKAYQLTLLKITTQQNCVAISNHFYQSLIKKRIVMLNKNQSNKRNFWKYFLILPALASFVFLFQIKVIAQEKKTKKITVFEVKKDAESIDIYKISKNTSDAEINKFAEALKENYGIIATFSGIKRNSKNELMAIGIDLKKGTEISNTTNYKSSAPLKTFGIIITKDEKGSLKVDFADDESVLEKKSEVISPDAPPSISENEITVNGTKVSSEELEKLLPDEIKSMDVFKNSANGKIKIITKKIPNDDNDVVIYVDGKETKVEELELLDQNIEDEQNPNKKVKTIKIVTKKMEEPAVNEQFPNPPTPPKFDIKSPKMPTPPVAPDGNSVDGDQKVWKNYEQKLEEYQKKMEAFEPDMKEFEKKMKQFEKKMKVYEKQMENYYSKKQG